MRFPQLVRFFVMFSVFAGIPYCIAFAQTTVPADSAAISTYRSGLKSISVPQPAAGFIEIGSDYRVLFDRLTPDTNRLIAAFLTKDDAEVLKSGKFVKPSRYALVENLRQAEFAEFDAATFQQTVPLVAQQLGTTMDANKADMEAELNRKLKAMAGSNTTITLDKTLQLGTFFTKTDAACFGMITPLTANGVTMKVASAVTVLRVQNRLLYLMIYADFKDEESVQWVRKTSEDWTDAILKANQQ